MLQRKNHKSTVTRQQQFQLKTSTKSKPISSRKPNTNLHHHYHHHQQQHTSIQQHQQQNDQPPLFSSPLSTSTTPLYQQQQQLEQYPHKLHSDIQSTTSTLTMTNMNKIRRNQLINRRQLQSLQFQSQRQFTTLLSKGSKMILNYSTNRNKSIKIKSSNSKSMKNHSSYSPKHITTQQSSFSTTHQRPNVDPNRFGLTSIALSENLSENEQFEMHFYKEIGSIDAIDVLTKNRIILLLEQQINPFHHQSLTTLFEQLTKVRSQANHVSTTTNPFNSDILMKYKELNEKLWKHQQNQQQTTVDIINNPQVAYREIPQLGRPSHNNLHRFNSLLQFHTDSTQTLLIDLITFILFTIQYDFLYDSNGKQIHLTQDQKENINEAFQFRLLNDILSGRIFTVDKCIQTVLRILAEAGIGKSDALLRIVPILTMICDFFGLPYVVTLDSLATTSPVQIHFTPSSTSSPKYSFQIYPLAPPQIVPKTDKKRVSLTNIFQYMPSNSIHIYEAMEFDRISLDKTVNNQYDCETFEDLSFEIDEIITNKRTTNPTFKCTTITVSSTPRMFKIHKVPNLKDSTSKTTHYTDEGLEPFHRLQCFEPSSATNIKSPPSSIFPHHCHLPLVLSKQHYYYFEVMNIMLKESLFTTKQFLLLPNKVGDNIKVHTNEINTFVTTINTINMKYFLPTFYQYLINFSHHRQHSSVYGPLDRPGHPKKSNVVFKSQYVYDMLFSLPDDSTLPFEFDVGSISNNNITKNYNYDDYERYDDEDQNHLILPISTPGQDTIYIDRKFTQKRLFELLTTTPTLRNAERILESFARNNVDYNTAQLLLQHIIHLSTDQIQSFLSYITKQYQLHLKRLHDFTTKQELSQQAQDELDELYDLSSQYDAIIKLALPLQQLQYLLLPQEDHINSLNSTSHLSLKRDPRQDPSSLLLAKWFNNWKIDFNINSPIKDPHSTLPLLINNVYFQQFLFPNSIIIHSNEHRNDLFKFFSEYCANINTPIIRYSAVRTIPPTILSSSSSSKNQSTTPISTNIKFALNPPASQFNYLQALTPGTLGNDAPNAELTILPIIHEIIDSGRTLTLTVPLPPTTEDLISTVKSKHYFQGQLKLVLKIDDGHDNRNDAFLQPEHRHTSPFEYKPPRSSIKSPLQFLRCPYQTELNSKKSEQLDSAREIIDHLNNGEMAMILTHHLQKSFDAVIFFCDNDHMYFAICEIRDRKSQKLITIPTSSDVLTFFNTVLEGKFNDFANITKKTSQVVVDSYFLLNLRQKKVGDANDDTPSDGEIPFAVHYHEPTTVGQSITSPRPFSQVEILHLLGTGVYQ